MKLILPALFLLVHSVHGQEVYNFSKLDRSLNLSSNERSVIFYPYELKGKARDRKVMVNGIEYHFLITKTIEGQRQEIVDSNNATLATTWFSGKKRNLVFLPDGSSYSLIKPGNDSWIYRKDGRDIIKGSYQKLSGKKSLTIVADPALPNQLALQIICLERGTDLIAGKTSSGPIWIAAILVGVLSAAINSH